MPHFSFSWSSISRSCCRFSLVASSSSSSTSSSSTSALLVVVEVDLDLDVDLDEEDVTLEDEFEDDVDEDGVGVPPFCVDLEVDGVGCLVIEIEWVDLDIAFDVDAGTE